jgi:ectoine hydroxylase-related dioxygenase (phytanoyl-CoA dioxygenase family)
VPIQHLPRDSSSDEICEALERDGCAVVDAALDRADIDQVTREMAPHLEATPTGEDEFHGLETQRVGTLVARSPKAREIIMNSTVLEVTAKVLSHAKTFQLNITEYVSLGAGSAAQEIHSDQMVEFAFPHGYETVLSTLWALTDFAEANGATRVVPGSHKLKAPRLFSQEESEPAEMQAGSVLLYTGSVHHGAGANRTDSNRDGLIIQYTLGWLRQEENQYLCVPLETLRELPEDLLRLMGYTRGAELLGFVDGGRDPIIAVRPEFERPMSEFAEEAPGKVS